MTALLSAAAVIAGAGFFAPVAHHGRRSLHVDASLERAWALLSDVEGLPKRNRSVRSVEVLERGKDHILKWRETLDMGQSAVIAVTDWQPRKSITWSLLDNGFGMQGSWTFELTPEDSGCLVTLSEDSRTENFMTRAALTLAGRDSNIQRMLADFERALR